MYAVGLSLGICNEEMLKRKEYFGQFGKIKKISVNRSSPYSTGQSRNGPTGAAYVTYLYDADAAACIEAIDGAVWDGRYVRACYGTTKYCAAFLKGVTCNNSDCLYMHDIVENDTFTKEDMLSGFANGKPPFYNLIYFDRSKGPVPGSLANRPPRGPAASTSGGGSATKGSEASSNEAAKSSSSPRKSFLSARSSGEAVDWPELNRRPSCFEMGSKDGTPRNGTPRNGTPRDATPRDGTPRNGTPRHSEEGTRLALPQRSIDGSWTHRSASTPRSPMQGSTSSQGRQDATPRKALAVLSSPVRVKMVTRPPPHAAKSVTTPGSRLSIDGSKPVSRPESQQSDAGEDTGCERKETEEKGVDSAVGRLSGSDTKKYSRSPLRSRPSLESTVSLKSEEQGPQHSEAVMPAGDTTDSHDGLPRGQEQEIYGSGRARGAAKARQLSPSTFSLSTDSHSMRTLQRTSSQKEGQKLTQASIEGSSRQDSLLGESLTLEQEGKAQVSAGIDDGSRLAVADDSATDGATTGGARGLPPGFNTAANLKGPLKSATSKRGPPPGFENSFVRRSSGQAEAVVQIDKKEDWPQRQAETQQTLQALQGVPALDQVSTATTTHQEGDALSLLRGTQVPKQNEQESNMQENRPNQDFANASAPVLGVPADVGGPSAWCSPELLIPQMQSLWMGLSSPQLAPGHLVHLNSQQAQPDNLQGIIPGVGAQFMDSAAHQLPGLHGAGNLQSLHSIGNSGTQQLHPSQLQDLEALRQMVGNQNPASTAAHQLAAGLPDNPSLSLLMESLSLNGRPPIQEQLHPTGLLQQPQVHPPFEAGNPLLDLLRQLQVGPTAKQKIPIGSEIQQSQALLGPLNDPAVVAAKKSERAGFSSIGARLASPQFHANHLRSQNLGNGNILMNGALHQHVPLEQHPGLGVSGLSSNLPQTPFAVGDGQTLLNNGLVGLGNNGLQGWGQANGQTVQVTPGLLGTAQPNSAGNDWMLSNGVLGANPDQNRFGIGARVDLGGGGPQFPIHMEPNNLKLFGGQGVSRSVSYGPL